MDPPLAPRDISKCIDTALHMYEENGLLEGRDFFVDNVAYYNGTLPCFRPSCNLRHASRLGWTASGEELQSLLERANIEAVAYVIPDTEDVSPAAAMGLLAPPQYGRHRYSRHSRSSCSSGYSPY